MTFKVFFPRSRRSDRARHGRDYGDWGDYGYGDWGDYGYGYRGRGRGSSVVVIVG